MGLFITVPVKDKSRIGDTVTKKLIYGTVYWFFHLVSDMAGTNNTAGEGTGLPGPILSLAKELAAIPFFNKMKVDDTDFSKFVSKLFNGTLFAQRDDSEKIIKETVVPIDLRTELGILHKQTFPVVLNEVIVRVFYAARRLSFEMKDKKVASFSDLGRLNWRSIIPFRNRTIVRMMTIASGTFTAVDIADAAIQSGGFNAACLLRINFVGVGRFAVAIGADVAMGIKRNKLVNEHIKVMSQELTLLNAKVYYKCAQIHYSEVDMIEAEESMWLAAQDAEQALTEAYSIAEESIVFVRDSLSAIHSDLEQISDYRESIEKLNPGLTRDISNIAKWGRK